KVPNLHESASIAEDGTINLSVSNLSASEAYEVQSILVETKVSDVSAMILTQETAAHNTFEDPDHVCAKPFTDFKVTEKGIDFTIPACSVVQFAIR
ncbi:MAG: alpha-N-arabinofuranosidase, partial [Clostridiales bacterium]|nr:alpha-N-arabinofuranosidase [Clostridiales bacterium]